MLMLKLLLCKNCYTKVSNTFQMSKLWFFLLAVTPVSVTVFDAKKTDRQSFHHSEGLGAPGGTPAASREYYRMNKHMKKYITKPVPSHLSSSPLLGLVHSLIGRPVFMCRLRETAAAHVVLTLYYHLFNGTGGSVAKNVHSVTIHQG